MAVLLPGMKPRPDRCHFPFLERARDSNTICSVLPHRFTRLYTKLYQHYGSDDNISTLVHLGCTHMEIPGIMFNYVCTTCKAYRATLGNQQRLTSTLVDPLRYWRIFDEGD